MEETSQVREQDGLLLLIWKWKSSSLKSLSLEPFLGNVTRLSTPWLTPGMEGRSLQEERSRVLADGRWRQEGQALGCLQAGLTAQGSLTLLVLFILYPHYTDVETEVQCAYLRVAHALA